MPVQTFCMYLGKAHSRVPVSLTQHVYECDDGHRKMHESSEGKLDEGLVSWVQGVYAFDA